MRLYVRNGTLSRVPHVSPTRVSPTLCSPKLAPSFSVIVSAGSFRLRTHIRFAYALTLVSPTGELMLTFPDRNLFSTAKTESGHAFCTDCTTEHTTNIRRSINVTRKFKLKQNLHSVF